MRSKRPLERRDTRTTPAQTESGKLYSGNRPGKLSVVSLGPGDRSYMALEAMDALRSADIIIGYKTYLDLIPDLLQNKKVAASGMRKEMERCQDAIEHALAGYSVALVSSGDVGIYGMAGLVLDICREKDLAVLELQGAPPVSPDLGAESGESTSSAPEKREADFFLHIIPGIPAFNAAASLAGAPLMHDFAAVSLSDHLTPWPVIEKRLAAVAEADFVLAIYNPRSKSRPDLLERARQILLQYREAVTPTAIIRRAMREGQWKCMTTLGQLPVEEVDMQSIVIVGNSRTYVWRGWMVTPRGYLDKYAVAGRAPA